MSNRKQKDTDYVFLTAMLCSRERNMVTAARQRQLLAASNFDESAKLLVDWGYPDLAGSTVPELEQKLADYKIGILEELTRLCPEPAFCNVFRLQYDYHNVKTLIKAEGIGMPYENVLQILSCVATIPPQTLADAFYQAQYINLSSTLSEAIEVSRAILARTGNPQLSDFELDRAYFLELRHIAQRLDSPFLSGYVRTLIDSANLKTVVRVLSMDTRLEFLQLALVPGGSVRTEHLAAAAMTHDGLVQIFTNSIFTEAAKLGSTAVHEKSYTEFERACDNAMVQYLKGARYRCFGEERVIAYIAALEYEITAVRMILTGKRSGIESAVIQERLRDCYV